MYLSPDSSSDGTRCVDRAAADSTFDCALNSITRGIEALLHIDTRDREGDELLHAMVALNRQQQRLFAAYAQLTRAYDVSKAWADTGAKSAAALLAYRCRMPAADAKAHIKLGRALERMPHVADSLARGDVGVYHARKLARLATNPRTCEGVHRG
jgi:hypothetical protein